MSRAARTLYVWFVYLAVLSATLMVAPNVLLRLFAVPETNEVWIRVVGVLLSLLAYMSLMSARTENAAYMRWSGHVRAVVPLYFGVFVALGLAPPVLMVFGLVDLAAAIWTLVSLRQDEREPVAPAAPAH